MLIQENKIFVFLILCQTTQSPKSNSSTHTRIPSEEENNNKKTKAKQSKKPTTLNQIKTENV